ncbi:MAG: WhiB family transcriptional regulator [Actinobacteria bacterium]|jgi:WhiB family redox-sensing transcriptional regulator|nr:WhiB family transcriptional regulator [Actinomycetota bacterium]
MDEPEYAWRYEARCAGEDTDTFYPPRDKTKYKIIATKAKAFCFGENGKNPCPVRAHCLWDAVARDEPHGIWGGYSHRERNAIVRKWQKSFKKKMDLKEYVFSIETEN